MKYYLLVIKSVHAIVAYGTMRGSRGPENFASEAIFELDSLILDEYLLGPWRRPIG